VVRRAVKHKVQYTFAVVAGVGADKVAGAGDIGHTEQQEADVQ